MGAGKNRPTMGESKALNYYWIFRGLDFGTFFRPVGVAEGSITREANLIKDRPLREVAVAVCTLHVHLVRTALKHVLCRLSAILALLSVLFLLSLLAQRLLLGFSLLSLLLSRDFLVLVSVSIVEPPPILVIRQGI
jgi:hypothetical protein